MTAERVIDTRIAAGRGASWTPRRLLPRWLRREPVWLWLAGFAVAGAAALPAVYLAVRAADSGDTAIDAIFDPDTVSMLWRTLQLIFLVTLGSVLIAVPLAWLTVRTDLPYRRAWAVASVLPLAIPSYVGALAFISAFGPRGLLQGWLEGPFGVERLPNLYGLTGAAVVLTLLSYPYVFLTVRATLWRLEPEMEEASWTLGRSPWQTFRRVTLPLLYPAIGAGALLVALYTLSDFGAVALLQYDTFTRVIFNEYNTSFDRAGAAALSLVLLGVAVALIMVEASARRRARYYSGANAARRDRRTVRLGRWRWPASAFAGVVTFLALGVPIFVLAYWLVRGIGAGETGLFDWTAAYNSIRYSLAAAAATVIAAVPISVLSVRRPGLLSAALERFSYVGFAMPGIAVGLGLVFFGIRYATDIYQTAYLLEFAYVVLFLPVAVGLIRASLLQVNPRMEEAAMSLGRSRANAFLTITVPIIWPGLAAAGIMVFLLTMKELPATLILGPIDSSTLATSIWTAAEEAFFARAAAPSLVLVLASAAPMTFLVLRERSTR
ncbi:MAG: iron ABC transporter permease [Chloroflexi bacterium]|nr:iron ABC transporter permease [Chloroflexota bacterium]